MQCHSLHDVIRSQGSASAWNTNQDREGNEILITNRNVCDIGNFAVHWNFESQMNCEVNQWYQGHHISFCSFRMYILRAWLQWQHTALSRCQPSSGPIQYTTKLCMVWEICTWLPFWKKGDTYPSRQLMWAWYGVSASQHWPTAKSLLGCGLLNKPPKNK